MSDKAEASRQIIQISQYGKWLVALCADGSLWLGRDRKGHWGWRQLPAIPLPADLLSLDMITREAVRLFRNSEKFLRTTDKQSDERAVSLDDYSRRILDRPFDEEFGRAGAKIGSQLRIRLPNEY